jgi:hypothetical protein
MFLKLDEMEFIFNFWNESNFLSILKELIDFIVITKVEVEIFIKIKYVMLWHDLPNQC